MSPTDAPEATQSPEVYETISFSPSENDGPVSSRAAFGRRRGKHVSRACNACRRKKVRCDGKRPSCAKCAYDTAHDKRRPVSKAYVIALEDRVAWLEGMLESQGASGDADEKLDDVLDEALLARPVTRSYRRRAMQASTDKPTEDPEEPESHLQVDGATGEVRAYGPTSMFKHLPAAEHGSTASSPLSAEHRVVGSERPGLLETAAVLHPPIELDAAMHDAALAAFFAFFNPWCWWVDGQRFHRDLAAAMREPGTMIRRHLRTAHYSPLLHLSILAIGVMYLDGLSYDERYLIADRLGRDAASYFENEIEDGKLSAVSGLMILGSHYAGSGRQSLGYIYAGSGLRFGRVLGLNADVSSWVDKGVISMESKFSRDRVGNAAYIQDKLWSTYVGREPAPSLSLRQIPVPAADDEEDARLWRGLGTGTSDGGGDGNQPRTSWTASTFTWTCKLARIVELIHTNLYSTRRSAYSGKALNAKYEICVLLEQWYGELPEPLRVSLAMLRSPTASSITPHVLNMHMMFHFAVILLHRPNYCDNSNPLRQTSTWTQSQTTTTAANERCNQSAEKLLSLAKLFDRTFGLRYATISMTQFLFTASTIHLLEVANDRSMDIDTTSVDECIVALHAMGRTWRCAAQSGHMLQRLLNEWHPTRANNTDGSGSTPSIAGKSAVSAHGATGSPSTSGTIDMGSLLAQNPDISEQLRRLGWAPPAQHTPQPSSAVAYYGNPAMPLDMSGFAQPGAITEPSTLQSFSPPNTAEDLSWILWPPRIFSSPYNPPLPAQGLSLLETLMSNDCMAGGTWSPMLNSEAGGGVWPMGRDTFSFNL